MRKLIVGNWKMNGTAAAIAEIKLISQTAARRPDVDVGLCVPFTLLHAALPFWRSLIIGAQDCSVGDFGAHTGCISAPMLQDAGAELVIVGHSERRGSQHESDNDVQAKAQAALASGLITIVCVGEDSHIRGSGQALQFVRDQLIASLPGEVARGELVVAYEPLWAIGSGTAASSNDIAEMHAMIRKTLTEMYQEAGKSIRILYGGSCQAGNCASIFSLEDVGGALVGGASLTADSFCPIIEKASELVGSDVSSLMPDRTVHPDRRQA